MKQVFNNHILIVDDDEDDRYIINLSFREIQWNDHIKLMDSGEGMIRYLESLKDTSTYPSLILLDYNMPRMTGEEALRRLKKNTTYQHIPVAVYSTGMTDDLCNKLRSLGASYCYKKSESITEGLVFAESLKREVLNSIVTD